MLKSNFSEKTKRIIFLTVFLIPLFVFESIGSDPPHHSGDGTFVNPYVDIDVRKPGLIDKVWWKFQYYALKKPFIQNNFEYSIIPPEFVNPPERINGGTVTWVGHATFLVQVDGLNILTDPVWSERVGILNSRIGPQRYTPPGVPWEKLPPIDAVVISHNHYDHLDFPTVLQLEEEHQPVFFVPLGVGELLEQWGISNIVEKDWWESGTMGGLHIIAVPAQHQARRNLHDHNTTLWAGWVIKASELTLYFAGDTGYFPGFREIGDRLGPIDLAMMPIGAYDPDWYNALYHVNPAEALKGFLDLDARFFAAMHWGTFDQSEEYLSDPPRELLHAVRNTGVDEERIWIFAFGESRMVPPRKKKEITTLGEEKQENTK